MGGFSGVVFGAAVAGVVTGTCAGTVASAGSTVVVGATVVDGVNSGTSFAFPDVLPVLELSP